jgi:demethylmenaquinone methyltransferase/2-methoxy-6-polyprenyl-1,4-benzoquinol methylase
VVLEIARPRGRLARLVFDTWFRRLIPVLGRWAGGGDAYRYLPASVLGYPAPERIARLMAEAGLVEVRWRWLATGLATLHVGVRPER